MDTNGVSESPDYFSDEYFGRSPTNEEKYDSDDIPRYNSVSNM